MAKASNFITVKIYAIHTLTTHNSLILKYNILDEDDKKIGKDYKEGGGLGFLFSFN